MSIEFTLLSSTLRDNFGRGVNYAEKLMIAENSSKQACSPWGC